MIITKLSILRSKMMGAFKEIVKTFNLFKRRGTEVNVNTKEGLRRD